MGPLLSLEAPGCSWPCTRLADQVRAECGLGCRGCRWGQYADRCSCKSFGNGMGFLARGSGVWWPGFLGWMASQLESCWVLLTGDVVLTGSAGRSGVACEGSTQSRRRGDEEARSSPDGSEAGARGVPARRPGSLIPCRAVGVTEGCQRRCHIGLMTCPVSSSGPAPFCWLPPPHPSSPSPRARPRTRPARPAVPGARSRPAPVAPARAAGALHPRAALGLGPRAARWARHAAAPGGRWAGGALCAAPARARWGRTLELCISSLFRRRVLL
jgi:hypothetical protein